MSFGAIGVEIMTKIKIMRVVIGFTKRKVVQLHKQRETKFLNWFPPLIERRR